ncbi:hypothetical protein AJ80_09773 [Polytolypa hystricis UAMH7299]|uniref:Metal homeostatis protein bsd2 n=1 Tax=Polytolypa hystricis (strain UAMH7299) TaxID=1447883 RepID=A0A2B7WJX4_POLH7|nr:hypothetical protein AJ80_09773 [Polytolypa hystricis UAMH7299]
MSSSHRYERVDTLDDQYDESPLQPYATAPIPSSPPPSFHSRTSSPTGHQRNNNLLSQDPLHSEADQALNDAFGDDGDHSDDDDEPDDRQRLMRGNAHDSDSAHGVSMGSGSGSGSGSNSRGGGDDDGEGERPPGIQRRPTLIPSFDTPPAPTSTRVIRSTNDGVFANLAAKPERGEKHEDLPPTYEQAAADATPPYWETTIVAPGMSSDEVYVDGLPVGSVFSFVWNGMISTSFQLVGFLLTYLLHTTHAAKQGSRAGLGLTLVQYGFYMRGGSDSGSHGPSDSSDTYTPPPDPNNHDFNPGSASQGDDDSGSGSGSLSGVSTSDWISYIMMIIGWFILIRSLSDYLRARRHEQLVLQSPERGLPVPVIAEGERSETVV